MRRVSTLWLAAVLLIGTAALIPAWADEKTSEDEAEALRVLNVAFEKDGKQTDQIAAIRSASKTNSATVSKAIGKHAVHSKNEAVLTEAVKALGRMPNPESVASLNHAYKAHAPIKRDEKFFITLLTAIGELGDPASVPVLIDHPFKHSTFATSRARIYGLGNIRDKSAVAALIRGIKLQGGQARGMFAVRNDELLPDFQTALTVLTGSDQGADRGLWTKWWRNAEKTFEMDPDMPVIPGKLEERWEAFWGKPYPVEEPPHGFPRFDWILNPTPEQVKMAVKDLDDARKSKSASQKLAAIYDNMLIVDPKVVKAIHKVAKKSGRSVIEAAIHALGWMPHKSALKELQGIYKRTRDLYKFENYYARMLKAIGRHSDESSLDLLMDKPLRGLTMASGRARILSCARVRSKKSVELLMKSMLLAGRDSRRPLQAGAGSQPFMGATRLALVILTGEDFGESKTAWQRWWRENKKAFKVSETRPKLDESMREAWEGYWEEPYAE